MQRALEHWQQQPPYSIRAQNLFGSGVLAKDFSNRSRVHVWQIDTKRSSFNLGIVLIILLPHRMMPVSFLSTIPPRLGVRFSGVMALMLSVSIQAAPQTSDPIQEQSTQQSVTVREPVRLSTKTPLGDAIVIIPSGTPVTVGETKEDWVLVKKPPFSAWIRTIQTSLVPAATNVAVPSPSATPTPVPILSASPAGDARDIGFRLPDWMPSFLIIPGFPWHLVLMGYGGFASILVLILFILLMKLRKTARVHLKPQQPVVSLEAKTPPLPGFVECPLCRAPLLIENLTPGENQCPTCSECFDCE